TNPPSYEPGNPGYLTWALAHADTGVWICSFLLSDSCGAEATDYLAIEVGMPFWGDCTGEGEINLADVVCLVSYLYKQGTPPDPVCKGDATGDGSTDVADVVMMVNYLFRGSFSPCFDCCDEP
ncbi:MAG: dockerin type I repeat-containing protein, partial [Candidatus Zixiibacteriota bacterium]